MVLAQMKASENRNTLCTSSLQKGMDGAKNLPPSRRRSSPAGVTKFFSNSPERKRDTPELVCLFPGGPEEIRTPDPYNANVMRSQLRYGPLCPLIILLSQTAVKEKVAFESAIV